MKVLSISDVAQLAWCQQKAKYLCQDKVLTLKNSRANPKTLVQQIEVMDKVCQDVYFHKNELSRISLARFLKSFNFSIVPKEYYYSKNIGCGYQEIDEEFVKVFQRIEVTSKINKNVQTKYKPLFKTWRDRIIRKIPFAIRFPSYWSDWAYPLWKQSDDYIERWNVDPQDSFSMGKYLEYRHSVKYSPVIKCFKWKKYHIFVAPDGITKKFCYEFKSAKMSFFWKDSSPVARVQANLYSYFFKRPYKRVEFLFKDSLKKRSVFEKTDRKGAEATLNLIDALLRNKVRAVPPKKYKCIRCEFRAKCTIREK